MNTPSPYPGHHVLTSHFNMCGNFHYHEHRCASGVGAPPLNTQPLQCMLEAVLTTVKRLVGLQGFGESILTTAKRVGGNLTPTKLSGSLQRLRKSFFTSARHVGGMERLGVSILTAGKHVEGRYHPRKMIKRPSETRRAEKCVRSLQKLGGCVLTSAKKVGGL